MECGSDKESQEHSNLMQGSLGLIPSPCQVEPLSMFPAWESPQDGGGQAVFWGHVWP